jgi:hypothetical protein
MYIYNCGQIAIGQIPGTFNLGRNFAVCSKVRYYTSTGKWCLDLNFHHFGSLVQFIRMSRTSALQ